MNHRFSALFIISLCEDIVKISFVFNILHRLKEKSDCNFEMLSSKLKILACFNCFGILSAVVIAVALRKHGPVPNFCWFLLKLVIFVAETVYSFTTQIGTNNNSSTQIGQLNQVISNFCIFKFWMSLGVLGVFGFICEKQLQSKTSSSEPESSSELASSSSSSVDMREIQLFYVVEPVLNDDPPTYEECMRKP